MRNRHPHILLRKRGLNWPFPPGPDLLGWECHAGGVVERLIAPVLKTGEAQAFVGSNPTPSAKSREAGSKRKRWDENGVRPPGAKRLEGAKPNWWSPA